jgi:hypothetical protein
LGEGDQEGQEEDVTSYWMTLKKTEDWNLKRVKTLDQIL